MDFLGVHVQIDRVIGAERAIQFGNADRPQQRLTYKHVVGGRRIKHDARYVNWTDRRVRWWSCAALRAVWSRTAGHAGQKGTVEGAIDEAHGLFPCSSHVPTKEASTEARKSGRCRTSPEHLPYEPYGALTHACPSNRHLFATARTHVCPSNRYLLATAR